jgi:hypothetical protein
MPVCDTGGGPRDDDPGPAEKAFPVTLDQDQKPPENWGNLNDDTVRIWDPHTGQAHHTLTGHTSIGDRAGRRRDGILLASTSIDRTCAARLWEIETGSAIAALAAGHPLTLVAWTGTTSLVLGGHRGPYFMALAEPHENFRAVD